MQADIAIVGCGAAGLMASIWAAHADPRLRVIGLDSARILGAKILVAGGGRCNITHDVVRPEDFNAESRPAVRNILAEFPVERTVEFFRDLGVELKREPGGKLFPVSDSARTVLDALLREVCALGVTLVHPRRVEMVEHDGHEFRIVGAEGSEAVRARRLILATGGRSLPRTGSDGHGYTLARALGHTVTETFPALVPLTLPREYFLCALSGVTLEAELELRGPTGARLAIERGPILLAHFGLSGPGTLDISRHVIAAGGGAALTACWVPGWTPQIADETIRGLSAQASPLRWLAERIPERLARALFEHAGIDPASRSHQLRRERRVALADALTRLPLPITGDRGFGHAEVTAGGVPLREVRLATMESRVCPGLYLCGEILDVDGRIGGYNFQWAWATGYLAGRGAAAGLTGRAS